MLPPALWSPVEVMSYPLGSSGQPERMENYLESVDPHWAGAETVRVEMGRCHLNCPADCCSSLPLSAKSLIPTRRLMVLLRL